MREQEIRLIHEAGVWVAVDVGEGVTAHGETRDEALASLDAELAMRDDEGDGGIEDADDLRREVGVEPEALGDADEGV
jgi:hypothetical protein